MHILSHVLNKEAEFKTENNTIENVKSIWDQVGSKSSLILNQNSLLENRSAHLSYFIREISSITKKQTIHMNP